MDIARLWTRIAETGTTPDRSFLAGAQRRAAERIIPWLPAALSPTDLARMEFWGALIAATALIASHWRIVFACIVPLGVALNWFGAALDGPLAQHRHQGGAGVGLTKHLTDLSSLLLIIVGYAFSPFLTVEAAAIVLACYLLYSSYTYLRAATGHVEQMALMGVGAAEFRLMLAVWPFLALSFGIDGGGTLNAATAILALVAVATLVFKIVVDAQKIASAKD